MFRQQRFTTDADIVLFISEGRIAYLHKLFRGVAVDFWVGVAARTRSHTSLFSCLDGGRMRTKMFEVISRTRTARSSSKHVEAYNMSKYKYRKIA